jgi:hypothetical protein
MTNYMNTSYAAGAFWAQSAASSWSAGSYADAIGAGALAGAMGLAGAVFEVNRAIHPVMVGAIRGPGSAGYNLPSNGRRTTDAAEVFRRLEKHNGISPELASERLHAIKHASERGGAANVVFDMSGGVYDPHTLELLGCLTQGGAK